MGAVEPERRSRQLRPAPHLTSRTRLHTPRAFTLSHGSTFLVARDHGHIEAHPGSQFGLFSDDTRFLSHHMIRINDRPLECVASSRLSFRHGRWMYLAPGVSAAQGDAAGVRVAASLDRAVSDRRMHEDIRVFVYGDARVSLTLTLAIQTDFADLFEVRSERWQRRIRLNTMWHPPDRLDTRYHRDRFTRRCLVRITSPGTRVTYANGELLFPVDLQPGESWRVCLQYDLITNSQARPGVAPCPINTPVVDRAERLRERWVRTAATAAAADPRLSAAFDQSIEDFAALRLYDHDFSPDVWLPAAGVPWFVAVFGRDPIIASLQALPVHSLFAIGTLQKLAQWQSDVWDERRDAEPGKICHEMRVGEWAQFNTVPHNPYYGTADATPLYLMLLAEAYRWLGDAVALSRFRTTAERCLDWIDRYGDRDGDGFQEYAPQTLEGYRNQCWRDAGDGVLDEAGGLPPHPIGTCEMQGYVYAAKLGVSAIFEAWGDRARAEALRDEAEALRARFNTIFWLGPRTGIAFALDGEKRPLETATSNPGHCLWTGILDPGRAAVVAERLMRPDLFSGWGLRTLSRDHPAYDPHSYQRGSVWPHDTIIAAAGMRRCGRDEDAWSLIDGVLAAASCFERSQLPELFGGLQRGEPDVPVPYREANAPQAWAAGAVFHSMRILLGLEPDLPAGRVYIDPALPPWCPQLGLDNVRVGAHRLSIQAWRRGDGSSVAEVSARDGALEVVTGRPPWFDGHPPPSG